jgi:hypothetical protein
MVCSNGNAGVPFSACGKRTPYDSQTCASVDPESGVKPPHSKPFLQPMIQRQPEWR